MNSVNDKYSRYTQGGETTTRDSKLGWWERRSFTSSTSDISITITPRYVGRPDLIAADVYDNSHWMWLVLQYNNIMDVNTELTLGRTITIPSKQRAMFHIMNQRLGGIKNKT